MFLNKFRKQIEANFGIINKTEMDISLFTRTKEEIKKVKRKNML